MTSGRIRAPWIWSALCTSVYKLKILQELLSVWLYVCQICDIWASAPACCNLNLILDCKNMDYPHSAMRLDIIRISGLFWNRQDHDCLFKEAIRIWTSNFHLHRLYQVMIKFDHCCVLSSERLKTLEACLIDWCCIIENVAIDLHRDKTGSEGCYRD